MAEVSQELLKAIKRAWDSAASLSVINGPYKDEKPPNLDVGFPYATITAEDSQSRGYSCSNRYYSTIVEIKLWGDTPEFLAPYANAVDRVFSSDTLSLTLESGALQSSRLIAIRYSADDKEVESARLRFEFQTSVPRVA